MDPIIRDTESSFLPAVRGSANDLPTDDPHHTKSQSPSSRTENYGAVSSKRMVSPQPVAQEVPLAFGVFVPGTVPIEADTTDNPTSNSPRKPDPPEVSAHQGTARSNDYGAPPKENEISLPEMEKGQPRRKIGIPRKSRIYGWLLLLVFCAAVAGGVCGSGACSSSKGSRGLPATPSPAPVPGPPTTFYCGSNSATATKCTSTCSGGTDTECPEGERCFAKISCTAPNPTNFCGTSYFDAGQRCADPCPQGFDLECPNSEKCFSGTTCD